MCWCDRLVYAAGSDVEAILLMKQSQTNSREEMLLCKIPRTFDRPSTI